jgi:Methyltransferase domain
MLPFWPDVLEPMLTMLAPPVIVEIGSESGKCTHRLLELTAAWDGQVHAVDPAPRFDVEAWNARYGARFSLHRAPSLDVIDKLPAFDVVLIDGDHNWYTVFHELQRLEARADALGRDMPLMFLHDVAWPYGRRDLYYEPDAIPPEHRQEYARRGISPTSSQLLDEGGFNAHLCNAATEGGAKNGVLTGLEDYLSQSDRTFELIRIPAVFGLAILVPQTLAEREPRLARFARAWTVPEIARFIDRMETARIAMLTGIAARAR